MIKIAIEPKSKGDLEKMSNGLIKLAQEDPSFNFSRDEETNQTVIEGMGELHLDIIVDRLRREFKVRCRRSPLSVLLQVLPVWGGRVCLWIRGGHKMQWKGAEDADEDESGLDCGHRVTHLMCEFKVSVENDKLF